MGPATASSRGASTLRARRRPPSSWSTPTPSAANREKAVRAAMAVPKLPADDTVASWWSGTASGRTAAANGVFARRFDATGAAVAQEFHGQLATPAQSQSFPTLDLDADGDFVVTWQSLGQDADINGIFARRFTSAGVAPGRRVPGQLPSPSARRAIPASASTTTATSSSPGRATARTERTMASLLAVSPRAARASIGELQVNTYTTSGAALPRCRPRRRRRLRRRVVELRPGRLVRRCLRPALRLRPGCPSAASSRSTPTPH